MKTLSKRWLVGAGALVIAAAVAVAVSQAVGGSGGRAVARAAEPQTAAAGLGQLSGQLPREKLTLESAIGAEMDLDAFYAAYRVDGRARLAYDPAMMVALLVYAYARGTRSSRVIERACSEDVAFSGDRGQQRPDHATIARFVESHQEAMAGLFGEVLTLCERHGLAKVGVIAVDGTKVQANASRNENLDYEQLAREIVEEAIATDAPEDELYGEARGDELPPDTPCTFASTSASGSARRLAAGIGSRRDA